MNNLEKIALERAVGYLKAAKFKYAIIDSDGNTYGDLPIEQKSGRTRSASKYPMGTIRNFYMPYVKDLQKDEGVEIPCEQYDLEDVRSNLCAWATVVWGKGNYSTITEKSTNSMIVFRLN